MIRNLPVFYSYMMDQWLAFAVILFCTESGCFGDTVSICSQGANGLSVKGITKYN